MKVLRLPSCHNMVYCIDQDVLTCSGCGYAVTRSLLKRTGVSVGDLKALRCFSKSDSELVTTGGI